MTSLAALVLTLTSWTALISISLPDAWASGADWILLGAPIAALVGAVLKPGDWKAPSPLWIPLAAASYAALSLWIGGDGSLGTGHVGGGAIATAVGLWLGWRTGERIRSLEIALADIIGTTPAVPLLRADDSDAMRREMRRARRHQRPLSVVCLTAERPARQEDLDRIVADIRRSTLDHYTDARLGRLLSERVDAASVVAREGDHFVLLLAETDRNEAQRAVARIEHEFSKELGISVRSGISSFPAEETTLTGLLETSELEMRRTQAWLDSPQEHVEKVET